MILKTTETICIFWSCRSRRSEHSKRKQHPRGSGQWCGGGGRGRSGGGRRQLLLDAPKLRRVLQQHGVPWTIGWPPRFSNQCRELKKLTQFGWNFKFISWFQESAASLESTWVKSRDADASWFYNSAGWDHRKWETLLINKSRWNIIFLWILKPSIFCIFRSNPVPKSATSSSHHITPSRLHSHLWLRNIKQKVLAKMYRDKTSHTF